MNGAAIDGFELLTLQDIEFVVSLEGTEIAVYTFN
jgi:hypothetical protein